MNAQSYEAWRPALAAFYRKDGLAQAAENVGKLGLPLTYLDRRTIDALAVAMDLAPVSHARAA